MKYLIALLLLTTTCTHAFARSAVHISCYRGPLKQVIWDKPRPEFVQSLVAFGYTSDTADSIATSICRDPYLVNNPEATKKRVMEILRANPPQS